MWSYSIGREEVVVEVHGEENFVPAEDPVYLENPVPEDKVPAVEDEMFAEDPKPVENKVSGMDAVPPTERVTLMEEPVMVVDLVDETGTYTCA